MPAAVTAVAMTSDGRQSSKGIVAEVMSAVIAVVVAVLLIAVMKRAFIKAILSADTDPLFQAKMISIAVSRMMLSPEGTKFYYHLPDSDECRIYVGNGIVFAEISGKKWLEPVITMPCNSTSEMNIRCSGSVFVFEKVNGSVVGYPEGEGPGEFGRMCK